MKIVTKDKKKSSIASTLITLVVILMLIISGPANAVPVSISGLAGEIITKDDIKTFTVTVTMESSDEFVPITNITLNVSGTVNKQWTFNPTTGAIISPSGDTNISVLPISAPDSNNSGYGYGYGVGNVSFIYQVNLSTASLAVGNYTATVYLNTGSGPYFASTAASFTVVPYYASFKLYVVELKPKGARFDPPIQIRFNYSLPLPGGVEENSLTVRYFNESTNSWEDIETVERNTAQHYIIANISYFSEYALIGTAISGGSSGG